MTYTPLPRTILLSVPLALALGACGGTDEIVDPNACDTTADCDLDNEVCHPFLKTCVTSTCDTDAECGGATPTCNVAANGPPIDDPAYLNLCVCSQTSCANGQRCDPVGGVCVAATGCTDADDCGEGELCDVATGSCFMACTEPGVVASPPCITNEVCLADGTCAVPCDDGQCVQDMLACADDVTEPTFNNCVSPDAVRGGCVNVQMNGPTYTSGAPIIVEVTPRDMTTATGCDDVSRYTARLYSMDPFSSMLLSDMAVVFVDQTGDEGVPFSLAPGEPGRDMINPSLEQDSTNPNVYTLRFSLCVADPDASLAIFVRDQMGDASNTYCF